MQLDFVTANFVIELCGICKTIKDCNTSRFAQKNVKCGHSKSGYVFEFDNQTLVIADKNTSRDHFFHRLTSPWDVY